MNEPFQFRADQVKVDILQIKGGANGAEEIMRIDREGRIFWHGREVQTDEEFRTAVMGLAEHLWKSPQ